MTYCSVHFPATLPVFKPQIGVRGELIRGKETCRMWPATFTLQPFICRAKTVFARRRTAPRSAPLHIWPQCGWSPSIPQTNTEERVKKKRHSLKHCRAFFFTFKILNFSCKNKQATQDGTSVENLCTSWIFVLRINLLFVFILFFCRCAY